MLISAAEIAMFENNIVIYKFIQDLHFFVTGGDDENELILATVLQGFSDVVALLLRYCNIKNPAFISWFHLKWSAMEASRPLKTSYCFW